MIQPTQPTTSILLSTVSVSVADEGRFIVVLKDDGDVVWEVC